MLLEETLQTSTDTPKILRTRKGQNFESEIAEAKYQINQRQKKGISIQIMIEDLFQQNPDITFAEINASLRSIDINDYEYKLIKNIFLQLQKRRGLVKKLIKTLDEKLSQISTSIGHESKDELRGAALFKLITGNDPIGRVYISDSPFSITINFDHFEDRKTVYDITRVSGSSGQYVDEFALQTKTDVFARLKSFLRIGDVEEKFPITFIFDTGVTRIDRVQTHEHSHGVNSVIYYAVKETNGQSLEDLERRKNYAKTSGMKFLGNLIRRFKSQEGLSVKDALQELKEHIINGDTLRMQFGMVQDELVADFSATGDFEHLKALKYNHPNIDAEAVNPVYFYYLRNMGIQKPVFADSKEPNATSEDKKLTQPVKPQLSDVFKEFTIWYNQKLENNVKLLSELVALRKRYPPKEEDPDYAVKKNNRDILAFMRQNPFQDWATMALRFFGEEYKELKEKESRDKTSIIEKKEQLKAITSQLLPNINRGLKFVSAYLERENNAEILGQLQAYQSQYSNLILRLNKALSSSTTEDVELLTSQIEELLKELSEVNTLLAAESEMSHIVDRVTSILKEKTGGILSSPYYQAYLIAKDFIEKRAISLEKLLEPLAGYKTTFKNRTGRIVETDVINYIQDPTSANAKTFFESYPELCNFVNHIVLPSSEELDLIRRTIIDKLKELLSEYSGLINKISNLENSDDYDTDKIRDIFALSPLIHLDPSELLSDLNSYRAKLDDLLNQINSFGAT